MRWTFLSLWLVGCGSDVPKDDAPSSEDPSSEPDTGGESDTPCTPQLWFQDRDGDGHGDPYSSVEGCPAPAGYVEDDTDCDDTDADAFPGQVWYGDIDGDGHGDPTLERASCTRPDGHVAVAGDCDDRDSTKHPEAVWYADADADGYGDAGAALPSCDAGAGDVANAEDCDDTNAELHPAATEVCDDYTDNNCNGLADEEDPGLEQRSRSALYLDADLDGWATDTYVGDHCPSSGIGVVDQGDCDDSDPAVNPAMLELPDSVDQNCDGESFYHFLETLPEGIGHDTADEEFGTHFWSTDLDADGDTDLLLGYPGADSETGELVWWDDSHPTDFSTPTTTTATWTGSTAGARLGHLVSPVGDLDGDGVEDILVTDQGEDGEAWSVHLLGATTPSGPISGSTWSWTLADSDAAFGTTLLLLGDIDGDGLSEALIGAPYANDDAGALFLIDANDIGSSTDADDLQSIAGDVYRSQFGLAVARVSDADGDGVDEVLTGSWKANNYGIGGAWLLTADDLTTAGGVASDAAAWSGVDNSVNFGKFVGSLGDLDNDGYGDFAMSSQLHDDPDGAGSLHLFYGSPTILEGGTVYDEEARLLSRHSFDEFGEGIHPVTDFDGDGASDLVIALPNADMEDSSGEVTDWWGHGTIYGISSQHLSGTHGIESPATFAIRGDNRLIRAGAAVASAGDRDGDGLDDLWLGSFDYYEPAGSIYLFGTEMLP